MSQAVRDIHFSRAFERRELDGKGGGERGLRTLGLEGEGFRNRYPDIVIIGRLICKHVVVPAGKDVFGSGRKRAFEEAASRPCSLPYVWDCVRRGGYIRALDTGFQIQGLGHRWRVWWARIQVPPTEGW